MPLAGALSDDVKILSVNATFYVRTDGKQLTDITINNSGSAFSGYAKITVANQAPYVESLGSITRGRSIKKLPVTDTNSLLNPGEVTLLKVELFDNAECSGAALAEYQNDSWERTRHWEFYLSQQMHTDLGYTGYQEDLKVAFSGYLDTVKEYMAESDERETDIQKYKYAIESGYLMGEAYLKNRNADEIQEILDLISAGRMSIGAGQFNYTMENFGTEETARAAYYTNRYLVDMLGIEPGTTERMFDNPAFSKSYVDIAASAGIKYGIHAMNGDRSPYHEKRVFDLFYMEGNNPDNKLLIFNGKHYAENYGFGGTHGDTEGSADKAAEKLISLMKELEARTGRTAYPYDKFMLTLVPFGDNSRPYDEQVKIGNQVNQQWEENGYAYPRITTALPEQFFEEIENEYGDMIPIESGTEENWWNDGWGTTAYESGINKLTGRLLPVAETTASLASALGGEAYPYSDLAEAVERNLIYDEHTWGNAAYDGSWQYENQFEWKRSNAFGAKALTEKVLDNSLSALASNVRTAGTSVYVYNPLNWERNDVVTITDISALPAQFVIKDGDVSIPYTINDGVLTFVAPGVPALGYKTFLIEEAPGTSTGEQGVVSGSDYIENKYYKVTFAADGTISSIIDKLNGNREIVDSEAEAGFNQYQYYDDFGIPFSNMRHEFSPDKWKLYVPKEESGKIKIEQDATGATVTLTTSTFRASSIVQRVTLYNDIPRIDISNDVLKESLLSLQAKEEAYYTFPFKASEGYEISYDLPIGNAKEGEQVYGTSTDWYTASKWVNVKDEDGYNMTLAIPDSALVQFGERRNGNWSFDYKSDNPYIYSYIMNNMWQTNFQGDQPGHVSFNYSISTSMDEGLAETSRFGWEVSTPLQAVVIDGKQSGNGAATGSFIGISSDNVQLSTMKMSEANSDGMILRFTEICGENSGRVTVTLPFEASEIIATDIIENDIQIVGSGKSFTFDIAAYGMATFRVRFGNADGKIAGLKVTSSHSADRENLSANAAVTASSYHSEPYLPDNALSRSNGLDWASNGEKVAWLQLNWDSPVTVKSFSLADRPNGTDDVESAVVTLSDGSRYEITEIPKGGKPLEFTLESSKTITWAKVEVTATDTTWNVGLSGFEFYNSTLEEIGISGTMLEWNPVDGALYYEIFRSTDQGFTAGTGNYLGVSENASFYDRQVTDGMKQPYYYKVRAVFAGTKGAASDAAVQKAGKITDSVLPGTPELGADVRDRDRIDLYWTPVFDNIAVDHYEIYRNGVMLAKTGDAYICSYRDYEVKPDGDYTYTVKAVDISGNASESRELIVGMANMWSGLSSLEVSVGDLSPAFESGQTDYTLNLGNLLNEGCYGVRFTPTAESDDAVITINGKEIASGSESWIVPLTDVGDEIVIRVTSGKKVKSYTVRIGNSSAVIAASDAWTGSEYAPEVGDQIPRNIVNNSGMSGSDSISDVHDAHGSAATMWHTAANPGENAWVVIDLGDSFAIDKMYVWNMNQANNSARGLKNVKIEYSTERDSGWTELSAGDMTFTDGAQGYPFQFAKAPGVAGISATNLNDGSNSPVSFGGAEARYVRITAAPAAGVGSWGDVYFGLSEVRFTEAVTGDFSGVGYAAEVAESAIAMLDISNDITAEIIMGAVSSALSRVGATAAWGDAFALVPAGETTDGKVSGTLIITRDGNTQTVTLDITIPRLGEDEEPEILLGDLNNDGEINVSDVVALRRAIMNNNADDYMRTAGDMDKNGVLNVNDVVILRQKIMEK